MFPTGVRWKTEMLLGRTVQANDPLFLIQKHKSLRREAYRLPDPGVALPQGLLKLPRDGAPLPAILTPSGENLRKTPGKPNLAAQNEPPTKPCP